jgi:hypothetical protein
MPRALPAARSLLRRALALKAARGGSLGVLLLASAAVFLSTSAAAGPVIFSATPPFGGSTVARTVYQTVPGAGPCTKSFHEPVAPSIVLTSGDIVTHNWDELSCAGSTSSPQTDQVDIQTNAGIGALAFNCGSVCSGTVPVTGFYNVSWSLDDSTNCSASFHGSINATASVGLNLSVYDISNSSYVIQSFVWFDTLTLTACNTASQSTHATSIPEHISGSLPLAVNNDYLIDSRLLTNCEVEIHSADALAAGTSHCNVSPTPYGGVLNNIQVGG